MNVHQSEALTLRTYPYAETHKIAVFLTRIFGKVRGVAHGAQGGKSRFGSSLEPLTHLRLSFSRKENQELAVIQSCEIIRALPAYQLTWEVNLHFSYFVELLTEFSKEQEESKMLFRLSLAVLQASRKAPIDLVARYFELWLLKLEGVLPGLEGKLPSALAAKTQDMMKLHPTQLHTINFSPAQSERLESLCGELVEYHLEKQLKTRKLLRELL
ncbi:MAG: DNA repair protein RecO [Acidobacteriota bacterium]